MNKRISLLLFIVATLLLGACTATAPPEAAQNTPAATAANAESAKPTVLVYSSPT